MNFNEGDVVVRVAKNYKSASGEMLSKALLGTVCRVITPGRLYKIQFEGLSLCVLQFHSSLAASGLQGPDCGGHDSCT